MNPPPAPPLSAELAEALDTAQAIAAAENAPAVRFEHFLLAALFLTYPPHIDRILRIAAGIRDAWQREAQN